MTEDHRNVLARRWGRPGAGQFEWRLRAWRLIFSCIGRSRRSMCCLLQRTLFFRRAKINARMQRSASHVNIGRCVALPCSWTCKHSRYCGWKRVDQFEWNDRLADTWMTKHGPCRHVQPLGLFVFIRASNESKIWFLSLLDCDQFGSFGQMLLGWPLRTGTLLTKSMCCTFWTPAFNRARWLRNFTIIS